jgi:hypothetical protein
MMVIGLYLVSICHYRAYKTPTGAHVIKPFVHKLAL